MTENELAEALTQYKQATQEEARLVQECQKARSEDPALAQAEKDIEELDEERRKASEIWDYFNNKFNKEHEALLKSLEEARRKRREAANSIDFIFCQITGADNEW